MARITLTGLAAGLTLMAAGAAAHGQAAIQRSLDPSLLHMDEGMAALSAPQVRDAVRASPLFLAEIDHASLVAESDTPLTLTEGVELNLSEYVRSTQITTQPVAALALAQPQTLGLAGAPAVVEEVFVLEDRIIVSREVTLAVTRATCAGIETLPDETPDRADTQRSVVALARSELCLRPPNPARANLRVDRQPVLLDPASELTGITRQRVMPGPQGVSLIAPPSEADIAEAAEEIRAELRQRPQGAPFRHGVSVRQALRLPDAELIRLDADGEERVISHVSIIPLAGLEQPAVVYDRLPEAALPQRDGFDAPIGPRLERLPDVLRPHVVSRQDLRRPHGRFTDRLENLVRPRAPAEQPTLRGLQPGRGALQRGIDPAVLNANTDRAEPQTVQTQRIRQSDSAYFITGFTLGRDIEERHKITFNKRRNYFVAFKYRVGYRAGLRFPFEVRYESDIGYRTDRDTGRWEPIFAGVTLDAAGVPGDARGVYAAAGMRPDLIADDREMTFGVWAWCQLQVRLPVIKTVRVNCPSISVPPEGRCPNWACSDFTPPLGRERRIADPRIPAHISGLQINAWVARAGVEPGVNVYARNAEFSLRAAPLGGRFAEEPNRAQSCAYTGRHMMASNRLDPDGACRLVFTQAEDGPMQFSLLTEEGGIPGVELSDPVYSFTMAFVPVLELFAEIDVAVAAWRVDKEIEIPGLTIRRDFRFERHAGTTESVLIGGCHPTDRNNSGCSRSQGYVFGPVRTERAGAPG